MRGEKTRMMPLRMLVLSLTGDCNLACRYCYASDQDRSTMTWDTARRAIDLAAESGVPFILQLSGGEPLLALPILVQIADYVRGNHIRARMDIQTNGTLISDEAAMRGLVSVSVLTADPLCTMRSDVFRTVAGPLLL